MRDLERHGPGALSRFTALRFFEASGRPRARARARRGVTLARSAIVAAVFLVLGCPERVDVAAPAGAAEDAAAGRDAIVAMARLEPASALVEVGAAIDDVVLEMRAHEGDAVEAGQVIAVLASHGLRQAELEAAQIELERVSLAPFEVAEQESRIRAARANLDHARSEVTNQQNLSGKGFSTGKEFRDAQLRVTQAEESLKEMQAELSRLEGSLALDKRNAENKVEQARQRLEQTIVRAPIAGQLLRVPVREGERVKGRPIAQLGDTSTMYAVAEVHANDVRLVAKGQHAVFSSPALQADVEGTVDDVGEIIFNNAIAGEDPRAPKGLRVVRVRVELADDPAAQRLTNLEGQVRIDLRPASAR
jgi:HlyD family secretion protein